MKAWQNEEIAANGLAVRENFAAWFGASRVVNEQGDPRVVYHGTAQTFDSFSLDRCGRNYGFRTGSKGFFFTSNPGTASVYAEYTARAYLNPKDPEKVDFGEGTAHIVPVFLRLERPLITQTKGSPDKFFDTHFVRLFERAEKAGADGIIVRGVGDTYTRDLFVAMRPEQIKSAIGNSGLFAPDSALLDDNPAALRALKARTVVESIQAPIEAMRP